MTSMDMQPDTARGVLSNLDLAHLPDNSEDRRVFETVQLLLDSVHGCLRDSANEKLRFDEKTDQIKAERERLEARLSKLNEELIEAINLLSRTNSAKNTTKSAISECRTHIDTLQASIEEINMQVEIAPDQLGELDEQVHQERRQSNQREEYLKDLSKKAPTDDHAMLQLHEEFDPYVSSRHGASVQHKGEMLEKDILQALRKKNILSKELLAFERELSNLKSQSERDDAAHGQALSEVKDISEGIINVQRAIDTSPLPELFISGREADQLRAMRQQSLGAYAVERSVE